MNKQEMDHIGFQLTSTKDQFEVTNHKAKPEP